MSKNQPKVFISYSHSSPVHKEWVRKLAEELMHNGIDVALDQWDLKPGQDVKAFMEQMVADTTIDKVVLICDAIYAEKATDYRGGVGVETQIISPKIYENLTQEKFIPVLAEKDDEGRPFLPVYCQSRVYIDLSDEGTYTENFEQLLRTIYGEPALVKPEIGESPAFSKDSAVSLGTASLRRQAMESVRHNKNEAIYLLKKYFSAFAQGMEKFRIRDRSKDFSETIENIKQLLPYSKEAVQVFSCIAQCATQRDDAVSEMQRFFERLLPYYEPHEGSYYETDFDNFKFVVHELFLCAIAEFLKHEKFECAARLIGASYYVPSRRRNDCMCSFTNIREYTSSFEHRNKVLQLKRASLRADTLKERATVIGIAFNDIMQADFVLYIKGVQMRMNEEGRGWWPETLIYAFEDHPAFEALARAQDMRYFDKIKCLWGIDSPDELRDILASDRDLPRWGYHYFLNSHHLANAGKLGTVK